MNFQISKGLLIALCAALFFFRSFGGGVTDDEKNSCPFRNRTIQEA